MALIRRVDYIKFLERKWQLKISNFIFLKTNLESHSKLWRMDALNPMSLIKVEPRSSSFGMMAFFILFLILGGKNDY